MSFVDTAEIVASLHGLLSKGPYRVQWNGQPTEYEIACADMSGLLEKSDIGEGR